MRLVPLQMDAVLVPDGANLLACMEEAMRQGVTVALTPAQVRYLLSDNARLVESRNDAVGRLYAFDRDN